jgi:O-antigen ligase
MKLTFGVFFIVTLFLCLPLPPILLSCLSPERFDGITAARHLTGSQPVWESISYASRSSFVWWVFLFSLLLFYNVLRHLFTDRKNLKIVVFMMVGIGLMESAYGLIQAISPSLGVLWVDYIEDYLGTARGTFINRNNFAAFINMIWPLALGVTLTTQGKLNSLKLILSTDRLNRHALMALGVIGLLLTLTLTRSRAGILSGLVAFVIFTAMLKAKKRHIGVPTRALLNGIVILLCAYAVTIGAGPVIERFLAVNTDGNFRTLIWHDSLSIIKDHPMGIGLRNYERVFSIYSQNFISDRTVTYAHNDYLQLLIETGWFGFLALMGGFILFVGKSFRLMGQLDPRDDPMTFYCALGALSGISSLVCHSFFDFNLQIPANCLYFATLMAILSSCLDKMISRQRIVAVKVRQTSRSN